MNKKNGLGDVHPLCPPRSITGSEVSKGIKCRKIHLSYLCETVVNGFECDG